MLVLALVLVVVVHFFPEEISMEHCLIVVFVLELSSREVQMGRISSVQQTLAMYLSCKSTENIHQ